MVDFILFYIFLTYYMLVELFLDPIFFFFNFNLNEINFNIAIKDGCISKRELIGR